MRSFLLLAFFAIASAHLCMETPAQRGGFPAAALTTPALDACKLITATCGGAAAGASAMTVAPGSTMSVTFVENEQHINVTQFGAGSFQFAICTGTCTAQSSFVAIPSATVPDKTTYTVPQVLMTNVTIPANTPTGAAVLQAMYVTYSNPGAQTPWPGIFYACADITVAHSSAVTFVPAILGMIILALIL
eukprot:TRINITY_DN2297_c0_g1_i1.p1 TRINITY_DN2297_c0_g1~~TRINITY_DN2297_c0_g1_i1.p1  ORF type:complete len:190 (-),score=48.17 TRINITY_DN2297_c0_g1_i1:16-585(-)